MPLSFDQLEVVHEQMARAIDRAGVDADLFLAKLALALAHELADVARIEATIHVSGMDLPHGMPETAQTPWYRKRPHTRASSDVVPHLENQKQCR